jgi:hypothetical protein
VCNTPCFPQVPCRFQIPPCNAVSSNLRKSTPLVLLYAAFLIALSLCCRLSSASAETSFLIGSLVTGAALSRSWRSSKPASSATCLLSRSTTSCGTCFAVACVVAVSMTDDMTSISSYCLPNSVMMASTCKSNHQPMLTLRKI